jgi:hypothetical protein
MTSLDLPTLPPVDYLIAEQKLIETIRRHHQLKQQALLLLHQPLSGLSQSTP